MKIKSFIRTAMLGGLVSIMGLTSCDNNTPDLVEYAKAKHDYKEIGFLDAPEVKFINSQRIFRISGNNKQYEIKPEHFSVNTKDKEHKGKVWICQADGEFYATEFLSEK